MVERAPRQSKGRCRVKAQRRGRIDHEIQRAIAEIVRDQVKDPRLGFVTITRCEISDDMQHCKVYVSIIGDRHVARQSMDALQSASRFIRGALGDAVELRFTPELSFIEDRSTEKAIALSKTISQASAVSAIAAPADASAETDDDD